MATIATFEAQLVEAVRAEISKRLKEECDKAILEGVERVKRELAQVVASVSLTILKEVSIEYMRNELIIHAKIDTGKRE